MNMEDTASGKAALQAVTGAAPGPDKQQPATVQAAPGVQMNAASSGQPPC